MKAFRQRAWRVYLATLLVLLFVSAAPAGADDIDVGGNRANAGEIIFDVLILRPLGTTATIGGFGAFLIVAPFLAPSREIPYGWETFVLGPADYTFKRPVGEF